MQSNFKRPKERLVLYGSEVKLTPDMLEWRFGGYFTLRAPSAYKEVCEFVIDNNSYFRDSVGIMDRLGIMEHLFYCRGYDMTYTFRQDQVGIDIRITPRLIFIRAYSEPGPNFFQRVVNRVRQWMS